VDGPEKRESDTEVLRRILAGLRDDGPPPLVAGVLAWPQGRGACRARAGRGVRGGLPAPPDWAVHSVVENGGVTHEHVSAVHPLVWLDRSTEAAEPARPTDVSVSVVDRPGNIRWLRLPPTIQIEGGSYSLAEARRLVRAIEGLIALVL
jgi:hypothetical protein